MQLRRGGVEMVEEAGVEMVDAVEETRRGVESRLNIL